MAIDVTLLTSKTRFVVVHFHIFKNAGTSIEHALEREFTGRFARLHGSTPDSMLDAEDLSLFLHEHPGIQAVTSHHLRYPLPAIRHTVLFDFCFLRHPLDRLDSLYSYYRMIDSAEALSRDARRLDRPEFFRHLIDRAPHLISNVQVMQISRQGAFTRPANDADLNLATATVRNMALPGLVEMYSESMIAGEHFLQPAFPGLRLGGQPANVSRRIVASAEERERRLIQLWGRDLHREMKRLNELDMELFHRTEDEVRRRLSLVPSVAGRAENFVNRHKYAEALAV